MKAILLLILVAMAGLVESTCVAQEARLWQGKLPFAGPVKVGGEPAVEYWLQLPDGFSEDRKWPLILFFSGRMYGTKPEQTNFLKPEFSNFRKRCRERGYVVCSVGRITNMWMNKRSREIVDACLGHVKANLPIDTRRIFAAGLSMGGGGALTYAKFRPKTVRAVCNFMGCTDFRRFYETGHYQESLSQAFGGPPDEVPDVYAAQSAVSDPEAFRAIPVITIHGDKDTCIPVWNATAFREKVRGFDNGSQCIILEGVGHTNEVVMGHEDRILDVFDAAIGK